MKLKLRILPAAVAGALAASMYGSAFAQAPAPVPQKVEKIEVTGSNIKRLDAETALPVTIITRVDIDRSGAQTTEELLNQISSVSSAGNVVSAALSGLSTYGQSSVSLRGLGGSRTLVLVDGRRLSVFAGGGGGSVNVNAIPLGAIERVEVLQDGASGVYGSDAIGGVINFIMRKTFDGIEIGAMSGKPTRSGGAEAEKFSIVGGFNSGRFSVVASYSKEKEDQLLGAARDFSKSDTRLPFYAGGATETGRIEGVWRGFPTSAIGEPLTNGRSLANPFGISGTGYGNPSAALGQCGNILMVPRSGLGFTGGSGLSTARLGPNCTFDTGPFVGLVPQREYQGGSANFRFKLNDTNEIFVDALYSENTFTNAIQPAPLRQAFFIGNSRFAGTTVAPALLIFPSNPNYAFAATYLNSVGLGAMVGQPLAVSQRTFLIGPRTTRDVAKQDRVVIGSKGSIGTLDYEAAYTTNNSETKGAVIDGFASMFELTRVLNNPANNWNPWAAGGVQSPALNTLIDGTKYKGATIGSESKNNGVDAKLAGTIMDLPGGPLAMAGGIQVRDEKYILSPSAAAGSGDIIGQGSALQPIDAKRNVWAVFAEVNAPITKDIEANFAIREDNYSDFGKTSNYKASIRWTPIKQVLLRSSIGTGFRAPTLPDLFTPQQINTTEQFIDPAFRGNGNIQVTSIGGGNPNLKPETSKQWSFGAVISPIASVTASVDIFNIEVKGLIAAPSAQQLVSDFRRGVAGAAAFVEVNGANEITLVRQLAGNVSSVKVSGADIDLRYREKLGPGRLELGLKGTYMDKYDLTTPAGELERSVGTTVRPDGDPLVAAATGVILKWKHNLSATYSLSDFSGTLTQNYYKGYEMAADLNGNRQFVTSQALYDLVLSYKGIKNLKLTVGAKNVFDKDPPLFISNGSQFQSGYDVYQYDPRGRFVYVSATYRFKF